MSPVEGTSLPGRRATSLHPEQPSPRTDPQAVRRRLTNRERLGRTDAQLANAAQFPARRGSVFRSVSFAEPTSSRNADHTCTSATWTGPTETHYTYTP